MTAVLLARVRAYGGQQAVDELLRLAGSGRTSEYLADIGNWVSYEEAIALWSAGAHVTHHPQFSRVVGEDAAWQLGGSPVAWLLRSLGSPEAVYRQIAVAANKFSTVSRLQTLAAGPGFAEVLAMGTDEFPRSADLCNWTCGMLSQPPVLFGLAPARVEHEQCAAFGAEQCLYRLTWRSADSAGEDSSASLASLQLQLRSMQERLQSIFAIAADLIAADDITGVLARITDRAAVEVRAPRYLLAVRFQPDGDLHCHQKGLDEREVGEYSARILERPPDTLPDSWLVVPVRSSRRDYGRLLALYDERREFFPKERELLEVYARYAASALDSATALMEATERYAQSSALLRLARALTVAGTTDEVARRLADAVPAVVDCDRVAVHLWEPSTKRLVRHAVSHRDGVAGIPERETRSGSPAHDGPLSRLLEDPSSEPLFVDASTGDPLLREVFAQLGAVATIVVPLAGADALLGLLTVSVMTGGTRLRPHPDLLDRLSGIAAQAVTALQSAHLVDRITYQAQHDGLTGLANRAKFTAELGAAIARARHGSGLVTLFYLDLDGFKPVNDRFGHEVGDELLAAVGGRLRLCTRTADAVARLGGDEFAVLIDAHGTAEDTEAIEARLTDAFERPFTVRGRMIHLRASIGRAAFPADAQSAGALMRLADEAMFAAKRDARAGRRGARRSPRSGGEKP